MLRPAVLLVLAACLLASCGGGGSDRQSAEQLLDQGFSHSMRSADLKLQAQVELKGLLDDPIRIEAQGPFRTRKGSLPAADIDLKLGSGGGQTIASGLLTTGDRAFVKFEDVYYEEPRAAVRRANEAIRRGGHSARSLTQLGLDPRSWIAAAQTKGDATVAGVKTRRVSGTLDVTRLMRNLNEFVRKSGAALGGAASAMPHLSSADIRQFAEAVKDPTFDVYIGKDDGIIRRVSGRVQFDIPKASQADLGGLKGGSITFSVEFHDVNGHQRIEAPAHARPLSELTNLLGGGGGIFGGLGGGADEAHPLTPQTNGTNTSPEAEAFQKYSQCLDKARPGDTKKLQRCADLLHQP